MKLMKGLTTASLKAHPSLIPLFVFLGAGMVGATAYTIRLATQSPDVSWSKATERPWNLVDAKYQYKFYAPIINYKKLETPEDRPDI